MLILSKPNSRSSQVFVKAEKKSFVSNKNRVYYNVCWWYHVSEI